MSSDPPPILDYASREDSDAIPFIADMRTWRSIAGWSLLATIVGSYFSLIVLAVGLISLALASILTLVYMTRAAAHEGGAGYAVRHLSLALLLTPVFFVGIFLITRLVEAE